MDVSSESSFGNDHVIRWVTTVEIYDLPVVRVVFLFKVAEFLRHIFVEPALRHKYLRICMKSSGVR